MHFAAPPHEDVQKPQGGGTVHIVDDDPDVLGSLRFLFETEGFRVKAYANGRDLLAEPERPGAADCLVIDYKLGGMDGLELVRRLRARQVTSPVVLVTVYEGVAARANAMGIADVLLKPHLEQNIVACVQDALNRAKDDLRESP